MKYIKKLIYVLLLAVATQVATAQIKILYGPYLQNVKENEATIVWVADKPSIGWVELAPNDGTHYYESFCMVFHGITYYINILIVST